MYKTEEEIRAWTEARGMGKSFFFQAEDGIRGAQESRGLGECV